jgi:signal recognition particle subunit SRP54
MGMIPGMGKALKGVKFDEHQVEQTAAIIKSMTVEERRNPRIIDGSRKKRIAAGSGNSVQAVNQLIKQFFAMQKLLGNMGKKKFKGIPQNLMPF